MKTNTRKITYWLEENPASTPVLDVHHQAPQGVCYQLRWSSRVRSRSEDGPGDMADSSDMADGTLILIRLIRHVLAQYPEYRRWQI